MVKVGFICEGFTEFFLLNSTAFKSYLESIGIELINVINAEGVGNLLPRNIEVHLLQLELAGAEKIVILTDLDTDICVTKTKQRIGARAQDVVVIAVRQIESWFLAATSTMKQLFKDGHFEFEFPELEITPFETIRKLKFEKTGSGVSSGKGGKIKLLNILLKLGYTIQQSAAHPNCTSAAYFVKRLKQIAN